MLPSRLFGVLWRLRWPSHAWESSSQGLPRREWNNWEGRTASESTLRFVASVYDELQNMLDAAAPDQILARGQDWSTIVSGDASKGSRFGQSSGSIVAVASRL